MGVITSSRRISDKSRRELAQIIAKYGGDLFRFVSTKTTDRIETSDGFVGATISRCHDGIAWHVDGPDSFPGSRGDGPTREAAVRILCVLLSRRASRL
ncbi:MULTISPECIES: hypothetical protein [Pirellulaceae]|uniref:Uncharacterized protein n=1 Tax=Aporhodopirellula aestuarii TaxID=2950107 RepID=A0ABT0U215_9BACT|nr:MULTISPECIES: hypothetical protein [Pirellulaceae]EMI41689.1 hypothetical protein RRSWK_05786 [Rhodopirellula sp. SWK7]MCM2370940.1 hypothetical protein [Aporhodopirellula aestuarii]